MFGASRRVARRTARRTSRRQMAMYGNQQQGGYDDGGYDEPAPQQYAPPPPAAPAEPDYVAELSKLAHLKDQGIISNEEFEAKKKQILGI
jgi:putative oligomerization/nucleic acid binding protein